MSFTTTMTFFVENCFACGVAFGLPAEYRRGLIQSRESFWCPNGHRQNYVGKNDADKLRDQLKREKDAHDRTRHNVFAANKRTERERRSHSATKGKLTKTHNRIKNGVCPFCNRSFEDLRKHMASKHAEEPCH